MDNLDPQSLEQLMTRLGRALSEGHIEADQRGEFSTRNWALLRDSGLLGLLLDPRYGGLAQSLPTAVRALESLGRSCLDSGTSFAAVTHMVSVGIPVQRFGAEALRERFLPRLCSGALIGAPAITEAHAGSDAFAMHTRATRRDGVYVLRGSKTFISNGPVADLFVVYALTDPERGALGGASAFLLERGTPGFSIGKPIAKMGLRTAPLCELFFDDCEIPEGQLLGEAGIGYPILDYVMKREILLSFAASLGTMQRRLNKCVEYARSRKQFGRPIAQYQAISHKLVNMRIGVEIGRNSLYRTAERIEAGENASLDVALTKLLISEQNLSSALHAVQIFGGHGYMVEHGLEKDLRDAVGGTLYSGTSEIQRERIARLMGLG